MGKTYKVKAKSIGGKTKRIFVFGETVTQDCFNTNIDELVEKGFLSVSGKSEKSDDKGPSAKERKEIIDGLETVEEVLEAISEEKTAGVLKHAESKIESLLLKDVEGSSVEELNSLIDWDIASDAVVEAAMKKVEELDK